MPATNDTRQKVAEMRDAGLTPRQIAQALAISTQAVYQHLSRLKETNDEEATA